MLAHLYGNNAIQYLNCSTSQISDRDREAKKLFILQNWNPAHGPDRRLT
jgi:hypothetical protein